MSIQEPPCTGIMEDWSNIGTNWPCCPQSLLSLWKATNLFPDQIRLPFSLTKTETTSLVIDIY